MRPPSSHDSALPARIVVPAWIATRIATRDATWVATCGARTLVCATLLLCGCSEPPAARYVPLYQAGPVLWASDAARVLEGLRDPADEHAGHALDGGGSWLPRKGGPPLPPDILVGGGSKYEADSTTHAQKRETASVFDGLDPRPLQSAAAVRFQGGRGGVHFAHSVAFAGDLAGRGDGRSDIAFGAPRAQFGEDEAFTEAGRLFVYFADRQVHAGSGAALLRGDAGVIVDARLAGGRFGWSLAGPGDLDGDGVDDLVVGAPGSDPTGGSPGRVYLISGAGLSSLRRETGGPLEIPLDHPRLAVRTIEGTTPGDRFGYAVAPAGDVDGDGRPDVVVGAPQFRDVGDATGPGYVSVIYGTGAPRDEPRRDVFPGEQFGSRFGCDVAGAVDLDGDGSPDLIVGASHFSKGGALLLGRAYALDPAAPGSWLHVITGEEPRAKFGHAVVGLRSIDGDALDEFVVGAPDAAPDPAQLLGTESGTPPGTPSGVPSGRDSADAPRGGPAAGKAFVFRGGTGPPGGRPELYYQVWGEQPRDHCGWSLAAAGDLDRNGVEDLLVGALAYPYQPADERGRVYVLLHPTP